MNSDFEKDLNDVLLELNGIKVEINKNKLSNTARFLTQYAVIRASGRIEYSFKEILCEKLKKDCNSSHDRIKNFFSKEIMESSSNPSTGMIEWHLNRFESSWKQNFSDRLRDASGNIKSDLNSLVQLRNDIAHGGQCNAGISAIITYYESGIKILKILYQVLTE
ncbi:TPA: HEPN domain-containing protein [Mannheimia haemolytica]